MSEVIVIGDTTVISENQAVDSSFLPLCGLEECLIGMHHCTKVNTEVSVLTFTRILKFAFLKLVLA